ncbi:MAG: phospholipase [Burkholderiaceae bacterium]|nr:phospholipase [Burkholderiaceae bacterium]
MSAPVLRPNGASCLQLYAGPRALACLRAQGLRPQDVRAVPAAAGGPKGLVLNPLDRYLFGRWLAGPGPSVHLVGASIGAWRMACATLDDAEAALRRLAEDYIAESYDPPTGESQTATNVSRRFAQLLGRHFDGRAAQVLGHPRLRLHVLTSRGRRGLLHREQRLATVAGYLGAYASNALSRRALGAWLQRVVFSDPREPLPLPLGDFPTRQVALQADNLQAAILASGSIPFWLRAVHDIPGGPPGAYWDGGITDYHLHWPWSGLPAQPDSAGLVLYPHFQPQLVPGWLDKAWKRRHRGDPGLDNLLILCPDPAWVASLPGGKLPDRQDFKTLPTDERIHRWRRAVAEAERLAEQFDAWLAAGCPLDRVQPLPA